MAKNIVFCADGTSNGPGQDLESERVSCDPTNVLKLYHWLDGKDTHADVGGGYPLNGHSGLSDVALKWMQNQLRDMLRFGIIHTPWKDLPFSPLGTYQRKFHQRPDILMYP